MDDDVTPNELGEVADVDADDDREDEAEDEAEDQDDAEVIPDEVPESPVITDPPPVDTTGLALRSLVLHNVTVGPTGLTVTGPMSLDEWAGIGELLRTLEHGLQWAIGDWICAGEGQFGDKAAQVLDHTAWSVKTTAVYRWAASRVPPENRRTDLTFSHHLVIAELPVEQQREWLERASRGTIGDGSEPWSVERLKREMAVASVKDSTLRYLLVVDCKTEKAREKLKTKLERQGHLCHCTEGTRKKGIKPGQRRKKIGRRSARPIGRRSRRP
jgi:hypothetical protein